MTAPSSDADAVRLERARELDSTTLLPVAFVFFASVGRASNASGS
jgi:hypothetical protein